MTMTLKKNLVFLLFLVVGIPVEAGAAITCEMDETPDACWARVDQEASSELVEELATKEAQDLRDEPTAVQAGEANLKSNTTDFLPLLALSGILGDAQEGDTEGTYLFDLNFLIPGLSKDKNSQLKAIVNSRPTVSEGIKEQIPEDGRDDLVAKIEGDLGSLDDFSLSYTFSWTDLTHGRGFKNYENRFASLTHALYRSFRSRASDVAKQRALKEVTDFLVAHPEIVIGDDLPTFEEISSQLAEGQEGIFDEFKQKFEAAANLAAAALAERRQMFIDAGLNRFANLLDNQPQLTFSANKWFRDSVVGGDETSIKVSYELGLANLNGALKRRCQEDLDTSAPETLSDEILARCLADYTRFVNDHKDDVTDGNKLSFSAEYADVKDKVFDLPDHDLTSLTINAAKKLVIAAGWSRKFLAGGEGEPVRLDFSGRYEDVSDDPERRDRGVFTLTVTRKVGGAEVPFGIVYANHGEFLGDVDERLSAHLGLKFSLGGTPEPAEEDSE
jgi:hypothetical protein